MRNFEEDFDNWFYKEYSSCVLWDMWQSDEIPFSMQWGVYVDFFDEKSIKVQIEPDQPERYESGDKYGWWVMTKDFMSSDNGDLDTLQQARKAALKKAIEIYENN